MAIDADPSGEDFLIVSRGGNYVLRAGLDDDGKLDIGAPNAVARFKTGNLPTGLVISRDGVVILIDPVSVNYMAGSEIDFVDDLIGASFKVNNPQAKASCGCGTSFAL